MEIEVKGYVLDTEFMSGGLDSQAPPLRYPRDVFNVWLKFRDSKDLSIISFGIQIPAEEYTEEKFREVVYCEALEAIDRMEKDQAEQRVKRADAEERKAALDSLGSKIGQNFGIDWMPTGRG